MDGSVWRCWAAWRRSTTLRESLAVAPDGPVAVIGGGIVGASVAYLLTTLAAGKEAVLVDSNEPAAATGAGAGIASPWLESDPRPAYRELTFAAARAYPQLEAALGANGEADPSYEVVGALNLAPNDQLAELARRTDSVRASGGLEIGEVAVLDAAEATRRFAPLEERAGAVCVRPVSMATGCARPCWRRRAALRSASCTVTRGWICGRDSWSASVSARTRSRRLRR